MANAPRSVEVSVRVYEVLIQAYPASFHREYGSEMTQVFRELATDALRQRGAVGLITAWLRVLGDLLRTAPQEHLIELRRRMEMKTAAFAIVSVILAAVVHLDVFAIVGMTMGAPLLMIGRNPVTELAIVYLPAFLTGMILARVKPFFMPRVTAPLGAVALWGLVAFQDGGAPWWAALGFAASLGLVSLLGCIVATKAQRGLGKFSVPSSYSAGTLAVLVCTSSVACVVWCVLAGNELGPSMRPVLTMCLYALLLIAAATIANLVLFAVRTRRKTELN